MPTENDAEPHDKETQEPMLQGFALSPDGGVVAFQFQSGTKGTRVAGLGLYDRQTGKLTRIPNSTGGWLREPSFSPDGTHLAAVIGKQIVTISLPTMTVTPLTHYGLGERSLIYSPIYTPDGKDVVYIKGGLGQRYRLVSVSVLGGSPHEILNKNAAFITVITNPFFNRPNEIIFTASSVDDPLLLHQVQSLGLSQKSMVAYRLRLGGDPELAYPKSQTLVNSFYGLFALTGAGSGKPPVFINQTNLGTKGRYDWDVFELEEDGQLKRLTFMNTILAYLSISRDGSTLAFGMDPQRQHVFDLYLLDMATKKVIPADLLRKITDNPDFSSR